jgi:hypothetical protein
VEKKVVEHLVPKCTAAARAMHKQEFRGWACLAAKIITSPNAKNPEFELDIVASPTNAEPGKEYLENDYHAHILCKSGMKGYGLALHLREVFKKGKIQPAARDPWFYRLRVLVLSVFTRLVKQKA